MLRCRRCARRKARGLLDPANRDPRERYSSLGDKIVEMGRIGQKAGGWCGWCGWFEMRSVYPCQSRVRCLTWTAPQILGWF